MLHAETDPPTMVEPPPGYVHRQPCTLEWCPGDAVEKRKESARKEKKKAQRYFESAKVKLEEEGSEEGEIRENDERSESEWFLGGFE